ncbi:HIRAN domain-containing protein [Sphingobium yanoikuyae]|uniref:HIRAN domain-containing protein n=1 Tax=Sphingobium yanoikuyae TaxID=13690 RepID=UPI0022DD37F4|nr:HIRAN domain-containing protein [Sphingobium yanoikuyae]WBQ17502.1 HIRAN domain-containing protein [Sphingobium yanoikuyae]
MRQLSLVIVGADYPNKDKSNRRTEILWSAPGERVDLIPEPKNPVDPQAVAAYSARGVQIGYVGSFQAQLIGSYIKRGRIAGCIFQGVHRDGAIVRVGLDGEHPMLPEDGQDPPLQDEPESPVSEDSGFYPDYIPPDD